MSGTTRTAVLQLRAGASASDLPTQRYNLTTLPGELRNAIYTQVAADSAAAQARTGWNPTPTLDGLAPPPMAAVSRQTRAEFLALFLASQTIRVDLDTTTTTCEALRLRFDALIERSWLGWVIDGPDAAAAVGLSATRGSDGAGRNSGNINDSSTNDSDSSTNDSDSDINDGDINDGNINDGNIMNHDNINNSNITNHGNPCRLRRVHLRILFTQPEPAGAGDPSTFLPHRAANFHIRHRGAATPFDVSATEDEDMAPRSSPWEHAGAVTAELRRRLEGLRGRGACDLGLTVAQVRDLVLGVLETCPVPEQLGPFKAEELAEGEEVGVEIWEWE